MKNLKFVIMSLVFLTSATLSLFFGESQTTWICLTGFWVVMGNWTLEEILDELRK